MACAMVPPAKLLWLLAVLAGAALRLYQIRDQVLVDDEWHALHALLAGGPLDVLLSFGASDHSIPLTLYDVLLERTVGLSELGMRLPSLVAGIAALVVDPVRWLRDVVGRARVRAARLAARAGAAARVLQPLRAAVRAGDAAELRRAGRALPLAGRPAGGCARSALVAARCSPPGCCRWCCPLVAAPLALAAVTVAARSASGVTARRGAACAPASPWSRSAGSCCLGAPLLAEPGALSGKVGARDDRARDPAAARASCCSARRRSRCASRLRGGSCSAAPSCSHGGHRASPRGSAIAAATQLVALVIARRTACASRSCSRATPSS